MLCIAMNSMGDVMFAASGGLSNIYKALPAETVDLMKAIQLANSFGMGHAIFSTDFMSLCLDIESSNADHAKLETIFRDTKVLLQMGFVEFKVVFQPRECNVSAQLLAGRVLRLDPGN